MLVQKTIFNLKKKETNFNINLKDSNEKTATSSCKMSNKKKMFLTIIQIFHKSISLENHQIEHKFAANLPTCSCSCTRTDVFTHQGHWHS